MGVFSGRLEKQDGRPGLWLAKNIWLLLWNRWREFNETWQDLGILFQVCIFRVGWKTRWPPWPLIGWDIFFSSEITEGHSTKLDRKQDLDVFYQVCVFRADRNPPPPPPGLWLAETFSTFPLKPLNRIQLILKRRSQHPLPSLWFFGRSKIKMATLASDSLRHFRYFLINFWTEFNETWHEVRCQRPLPSLRFRAVRKNKMAALTDLSKKWHIVFRCTICGPLGPLIHDPIYTCL